MLLLRNLVESHKGKERSIYCASRARPAAVGKLHGGFASVLMANCTWVSTGSQSTVTTNLELQERRGQKKKLEGNIKINLREKVENYYQRLKGIYVIKFFLPYKPSHILRISSSQKLLTELWNRTWMGFREVASTKGHCKSMVKLTCCTVGLGREPVLPCDTWVIFEPFRHAAHPCFYTQAIETMLMPALWVVVKQEDSVC